MQPNHDAVGTAATLVAIDARATVEDRSEPLGNGIAFREDTTAFLKRELLRRSETGDRRRSRRALLRDYFAAHKNNDEKCGQGARA